MDCRNIKGNAKSNALRTRKGECFRNVAEDLLRMEAEEEREYRIIISSTGKIGKSYRDCHFYKANKHDEDCHGMSTAEKIEYEAGEAITGGLGDELRKQREEAGKTYNKCQIICTHLGSAWSECMKQVERKGLEDEWCYRSF